MIFKITNLTKPPSFSNIIILYLVLFCSVLTPKRKHLWQALKVYVPDFESGGRMWPHIHSRILAALFIGQITMMGYFGIKQFPYAVLVIVLPLFTIFFASICKMNYYPSFNVMSLAIASEDVKQAPPMRQIVAAYTPECLLNDEATVYDASEEKFEDARDSIGSLSVSRSTSDVHSNSTEELYKL